MSDNAPPPDDDAPEPDPEHTRRKFGYGEDQGMPVYTPPPDDED